MKERNISVASDKEDFDIAEPHAEAMIESLRAFGYDLQTAIADLIDNSITAQARNVWLVFNWDGENSHISIRDDGTGMAEAELVKAMRPGSQSPLEPRSAKDLGRFGLGLKTASFSQCRLLTVRSKTPKGKAVTRCWDLDYVVKTGEWRLLKNARRESEKHLSSFSNTAGGTIVLWECIDRVVGGTKVNNPDQQKWFLDRVNIVKDHLAMVFHRFLQRPNGLKIWINDRKIDPWDPFLSKEPATQRLNEESLRIAGGKVTVKPYILPHHSKISPQIHTLAAGPRGWNDQQGFYIYRNERLLVAGDWLGLGFQKEEHHKLSRILLDIPNSMDSIWAIDVKKSRAKPPAPLRPDLKRIAKLTRERASAIYRHRGKVIARESAASFIFVWEKKVKHGKMFYTINRNHPVVSEFIKDSKELSAKINPLLRLLEETIPVPLIVLNNAENPDRENIPFEESPSKELTLLMTQAYQALLNSGLTKQQARERLSVIEPFDRYPELLASIIDSGK